MVNDWNMDTRKSIARALSTTTQFITFEKLTEGQFTKLLAHVYGGQNAADAAQVNSARATMEWAAAGGATAGDVERGAVNYGASARVSDLTRMAVIDLSDDAEMAALARQPIDRLPIADLTRLSIYYFIRARASDWHLEHGNRTGSRIRYRCDGVLHPKFRGLPLDVGKRIGNSLSQMAGVDYSDTTRRPLNATITALIARDGRQEEIELRYASLPTRPFPEYVLRSQSDVITDVKRIGLLKPHYVQVDSMLSNTQGVILVTGPTGSGKTNTLAAYRTIVEQPDNRKIISMEDPIEIYSDYTSQMAITRDNGWEEGFYGMLRNDPDVIIVGELRSKHSVHIALEAAMTGHLVFATFHTSNVESTFSRLLKMGVLPEQLSDSIIAVQSQRLARTLCQCKVVDEIESAAHGCTLYMPKGCPVCLGIGYKGRTAIPELLLVNDDIRDWLSSGVPHKEIVERAARAGWMMLMEDVARAKVMAGITTFKEIDRVAKFTEAKAREHERRNFYADEVRRRAEATGGAATADAPDVADENANAVDAEWEELRTSPESEDPLDIS
jgi:type II secretory ATPase GspE/PulE/Tfp pilus assembly ATPase PilB-like protein